MAEPDDLALPEIAMPKFEPQPRTSSRRALRPGSKK